MAYIKSKNFKSLKIVEDIIENSFNILPTTSSLGFALLCEKIKKMKSKVVLTGVGGDELFSGYYVNFFADILSSKGNDKKIKIINWKRNIRQFIRNEHLKDFDKKELKKNIFKLNFYIEGKEILNKFFKDNSLPKIKKLSNDVFYNNMLQNIFLQSIPTQNFANDLVAMHYSIEPRAPFLSQRLFKFIFFVKKKFFYV